MTQAADATGKDGVQARSRRHSYFGFRIWLVLEATALVALLLIDYSPTERGIGTAAALAGFIALVVVFRLPSRRESGAG